MGTLKSPPPLVQRLNPGVAPYLGDERARDQHRSRTQAWRAWYKTPRWRAMRNMVLLRDLFQCRICKRVEGNTSLLVCDHIVPHHGDERLFWDETNLRCLCKPCHDSVKQAEDKARR